MPIFKSIPLLLLCLIGGYAVLMLTPGNPFLSGVRNVSTDGYAYLISVLIGLTVAYPLAAVGYFFRNQMKRKWPLTACVLAIPVFGLVTALLISDHESGHWNQPWYSLGPILYAMIGWIVAGLFAMICGLVPSQRKVTRWAAGLSLVGAVLSLFGGMPLSSLLGNDSVYIGIIGMALIGLVISLSSATFYGTKNDQLSER